ncbi:MAG: PKD domain-containing protein [Methanomicrobiales archaeon]|nr:PKD domain-containing protein [Methanomicrobiales archaeon]
MLLFLCGITAGDIPPISVQNAHTSLSADFTADTISGTVPLAVSFTDVSSGLIENYSWNFGDGDYSLEKNPVHTYQSPGVYTVSLEVFGTGGTDKKTRIGYIKVEQPVTKPGKDFIPGALNNKNDDTHIESIPDERAESTNIILSEPKVIEETKGDTTEIKENLFSSNSIPDKEIPPVIIAEFSIRDTKGFAPLELSFTDESSGNIQKWLWTFGDGTSSTTKSPVHTYQKPGKYSVTLTVEGDGNSDSITKTDLVHVTEQVSADFEAQVTDGIAPLKVTFNEHNTGDITKREWSFGDGSISEIENPNHVYEKPGTYDVSLKVYGHENEDEETKLSYILVGPDLPKPTPPPVPMNNNIQETGEFNSLSENYQDENVSPVHELLSDNENQEPLPESTINEPDLSVPMISSLIAECSVTPTQGVVPLEITCHDQSSGEITGYYWDFGDETSSTEKNPIHRYERPGEYVINFTIYSDESDKYVNKVIPVTVNEVPLKPKAEFSVSSTEGVAPFSLFLTDMSTGEITDWIWDFGNGKLIRGRNPVHTYYDSGEFSITLTVKGPGGKDEYTQKVLVRPPEIPLKASFQYENNKGYLPLKTQFFDTSSGQISGWHWDFGDGTISTEQNPIHEYSTPGTFSVHLTISGHNGMNETIQEKIITVNEPVIPVKASFSANPVNGDAPLEVSFTDKSLGNISSWYWQFGDGETSTLQSPDHSYTKPGIYSVSLEVKGENGLDTTTKKDIIAVMGSVLSPELIIEAIPSEGDAPLSVSFSRKPEGNERSFLWSFGDGATSSESSPSYVYTKPGIFDISLTIQDALGQNRTITKIGLVNVTRPIPPPTANFTMNSTTGTVPCTIRFTDLSTGDITNWTWEFEPSIFVSSQDPLYTFTRPDSYPVNLTVTGPGGSDHIIREIIVSLPEIEEPVTIKQQDLIENDVSGNADTSEELTQPAEISALTVTKPGVILADIQQKPDGNETAIIQNPYPAALEVEIPEKIADEGDISNITYPLLYASATKGAAPMKITFSSSWSGTPGSFLWEFGDGTTSDQMEPEHVYSQPGLYSVQLTHGSESYEEKVIGTDLIEITKAVAAPVASFTAEPLTGYAPLNVLFTSTSTGSSYNWKWNFGDKKTGQGEAITHTYTKAGNYSVTLNVTGPQGSSGDIYTDFITVLPPRTPPEADFITVNRTGSAPLDVQFIDRSKGEITKTHWEFGDGNESMEKNPVHQYNNTGMYTVKLNVEGPDGIDSITRQGYVVVRPSINPLVARFQVSPSLGKAPLIVECTSSSSGTINRLLWEFGDGAVSEDNNPVHQYVNPGTYLLKLTVYGMNTMSSADQTVTVLPNEATANDQPVQGRILHHYRIL